MIRQMFDIFQTMYGGNDGLKILSINSNVTNTQRLWLYQYKNILPTPKNNDCNIY